MSFSNNLQHCIIVRPNTMDTSMTVQPALDLFSDVSENYIHRYDGFAPDQTYFIFDSPLSANNACLQLEKIGYRVHITYQNGTTYATSAKTIFAGILL